MPNQSPPHTRFWTAPASSPHSTYTGMGPLSDRLPSGTAPPVLPRAILPKPPSLAARHRWLLARAVDHRSDIVPIPAYVRVVDESAGCVRYELLCRRCTSGYPLAPQARPAAPVAGV